MAYGFYSINAAGIVQIDSDFSNIAVIASGSFSQTTGGTYSYQITDQDFYFIRSTTQGQYISAYTYKGNNNLLYLAITVYAASQGLNCVVDFLKCRGSKDIYSTPPNTNYGLNIMRSDGTVAFSSEIVSPQITNILSINTSTLDLYGTNSLSFSMSAPASGKKRYFAVNSFNILGVLEWSPDFGDTMYLSEVCISASNINNTLLSIKCSTPYTDGMVFSTARRDSINQLLITDY